MSGESADEGPGTFERLPERISDGFYAVDDDWRLTYWNQRIADRTGTRPEEAHGERLWDLFPGLRGTEFETEFREAMATREDRSFETYIEDPFGYWVEVDVYPDESGLSVFSREITARKERERDLQRTRDRLDAIIEATPDPVLMVDENLEVTLWNPAAERVFGWSRAEIIGERAPHVPAERDEEFLDFIENLDGGRPNSFVETVRRAKDGERIDVSLSSAKIDIGDEVGYVAIFKDIRQRKEYERRLEAQRDRLEVLNEMVRHDIRNEVQVILSYATLLEPALDGDEREYLETVISSATSVVDLTEAARELAEVMLRADSENEPVPLRRVLEQELSNLRSKHPDAAIVTADSIPGVDVLADDMLSSVFRNVLTNAVTHNDSDVPHIGVSVHETPDSVLVRIADNGPGIPESRRSTVFGRGEKGRESDGTGLGLYLVDELVDRYDGEVRVDGASTGRDAIEATDAATGSDATEAIDGPVGAVFSIRLNRP